MGYWRGAAEGRGKMRGFVRGFGVPVGRIW